MVWGSDISPWNLHITALSSKRAFFGQKLKRLYSNFAKIGYNYQNGNLYEGHSRSNNAYFFLHLGNTDATKCAHVLRIVTPVRTKNFDWIQWVLYVFGLHNDEYERNFALWLLGVKCCLFFNKWKLFWSWNSSVVYALPIGKWKR